jgi:proton-translocating NAD(P)+ transhydrogenase subunit beta
MPAAIVNFAYLIAAVLFILGLKGLTHPRTAVRGNLLGALGMFVAIVFTLLQGNFDYKYIAIGLLLGGVIGAIAAIKVLMTSMPQMVAMFNGFGGIASVLVAGAALVLETIPMWREVQAGGGDQAMYFQASIATAVSGLIGAVTFWGSLIAFFKLKDVRWIPDGQLFPGQSALNVLLALTCAGMGVILVMDPTQLWAYWTIVAVASLLGLLLTMPIGGADMPVVIALLNSYSGLAAAATGFVISNNVLIIAGSLVGASGIILTRIMCRAMNRSLTNVLFGTMGPTGSTPDADEIYEGKVTATSAEEVAMLFETAQRVVIIPGYGMAVAQAQHAVRDLTVLLEARGVNVEFGIHPVAGRMPGHMNVLLAEVDIDYEKLLDLDQINSTIEQADVALVLGANDVVNPVARTDPQSPIAGMPIIDVDRARTVVVIKRSLSPGFAGIPNPLFAADNALMYFSDGKKAMIELVAATKELD